jgi:nickel/cobalt transporter (NiCoT) family protein
MHFLQLHISGFIILFVLGLRHGLDPDHITVIDNFTYKLHQNKNTWSRWVGTLFTFGHGVMVTLISVVLSLLKNNIEFPDWFNVILEWVPVVILLAMGVANLITLTNRNSKKQKTVSRFKNWMIPKHTGHHLNPFSIILTGLIFGFIFDTSSQIAAFGITMSSSNQWIYAVLGGVVFSFGLILTGTCDSFLLNKLLKTFDRKKITAHRFKLNVLITIMCFAIPIYKIICYINPFFELSDFQNNIVGLTFIGIIISLYAELYLKYRFLSKKAILQEESQLSNDPFIKEENRYE